MYNLDGLIMKNFSLIFLLFSGFATTSLFAQQMNATINDPVRNRVILIDQVNREGLLKGEIGEFFQPDYDAYRPDSLSIEQLKGKLDNISIHIVFGSWCGDSKDQLPRFLKVLDQIGFNGSQLKMTAVDSHKTGRNIDVGGLNILKVPTFVVYRKSVEIGRIIETPLDLLEKDLLQILEKDSLQP